MSVIEIFWDEVFMVRKTVKNGQPWCLAVNCRKRSDFDVQFHLIAVSIFLKMCVKDHGDSSSLLLQRGIWLVFIKALNWLYYVSRYSWYIPPIPPQRGWAPLIFRPNWGPKKFFLETSPTPPPPHPLPKLKFWIYYCLVSGFVNISVYFTN